MASSPDRLRELTIYLGWEVEPPREAQQAIDRSIADTGSKAVAIGNLVSTAITRAVDLALRGVQQLVGGLAQSVTRFAEVGSELSRTAAGAGVTTTELQRLEQSARRFGIQADTVKEALKVLNIGLTEARTKGTGPFAEGLSLVGVKIKDLQGLTPEQTIGLLGEALQEVQDPAERAAASAKLFGETAGQQLAPMLKLSSAELAALGDEAERSGRVLDDEAIAASQRLAGAMLDVDAAVGAASNKIGESLAPYATEVAARIGAWVDSNDQLLQQDLPAAIMAIVDALGSLVAWAGDTISEFRQFGRLIGEVAGDARSLGSDLADLASTVGDRVMPVVEAVHAPLAAVAGAIGEITGAVVDAIAKLLDMIGVLDSVREAVNALPGMGESIDELDARLGGTTTTRGAPAVAGGPSRARGALQSSSSDIASALASGQGTPQQRSALIAALPVAVAREQAAILSGQATAAAASETAAEGRRRAAASRGRAAARAAAAAAGAKGGGKGGGAGAKSSSGGSLLDRLFPNGFGDSSGGGLLDSLGGLLSGGAGAARSAVAAAAGPSVGPTFASNTFHVTIGPTTVQLAAPAGTPTRELADMIGRVIDDRNRRAFDAVDSQVRRP